MAEIETYFEAKNGKIENVFHEIVSDDVHIDVYVMEPNNGQRILFTVGMSAKPMPHAPAGKEFAEVMIALPVSWPVSQEELNNEENYWPIFVLKTFARLPHGNRCFIPRYISIPSSHPEEVPYAGTNFTAAMLESPVPLLGPGSDVITMGNKEVHLHTIMPITKEECAIKVSSRDPEFLHREFTRVGADFRDLLIVNKNRSSVF